MPKNAAAVRNLPLDIIVPTDYVQFAVKLAKGDLVLLYTDALMESRNANGDRGLGSVPPP